MAYRDFTNWWQSLIHHEKYNAINQLLGTPLSTVSVTDDIFTQLGKFIDAQDRYVEYKFINQDYTNDFLQYLDNINDDSFWKRRLVDALKTEISSIVITDLPKIQNTARPEPYSYLVSVRNIVDIEINQFNGNVEYIIFKQTDSELTQSTYNNPAFQLISASVAPGDKINNFIVLDDTSYRVFSKKQDSDAGSIDSYFVTFESDHNLGYCPAIDFWSPSIKGSDRINKKGPITKVLKKLNYLLFFRACAEYMNLYGPFPVFVTYEEEDEDFDQKNAQGNFGNVYQMDTFNAYNNDMYVNDPRRSSKNLIGPGSRSEMKAPVDKDDFNMMDTPMKIIGMDAEILKYVDEKVKKLENEIVELCTGEDTEYLNEIAKNPEMLSASFERKDSILTTIKREFERVHKFVTKVRTELRYGKGYFLNATIDYGSDYFLKDSNTLVTEFGESLKAGMPQSYCAGIARAASETRYKNNPEILARTRILNDLEPYINLSWADLKLLEINTSDQLNFIVKVNFGAFIKRFELENNSSIVKFGSAIPYNQKISIIKQNLINYANGTKWVAPVAKSIRATS